MITYYEKPNTRKITVEKERGKSARITWTKVDPDSWENLSRAQIGGTYPDDATLKCVRTEVDYIGGPNAQGDYDYCEVTAHYADPDYDPRQYSWQEKEIERGINVAFGMEWVSLPDRKVKWDIVGGTEIPQNVSIPCGVVFITMAMERNQLPFDLIAECVGKINDDVVTIEHGRFATGKLRFDSADSEQYRDDWIITYRFAYNRNGWQNLPKTDGATITWTPTYPALYEETDLSRLL